MASECGGVNESEGGSETDEEGAETVETDSHVTSEPQSVIRHWIQTSVRGRAVEPGLYVVPTPIGR